jgi:hypothetical protein
MYPKRQIRTPPANSDVKAAMASPTAMRFIPLSVPLMLMRERGRKPATEEDAKDASDASVERQKPFASLATLASFAWTCVAPATPAGARETG